MSQKYKYRCTKVHLHQQCNSVCIPTHLPMLNIISLNIIVCFLLVFCDWWSSSFPYFYIVLSFLFYLKYIEVIVYFFQMSYFQYLSLPYWFEMLLLCHVPNFFLYFDLFLDLHSFLLACLFHLILILIAFDILIAPLHTFKYIYIVPLY